MEKDFIVKNIGVDAGLILVSDKDFYKKYNGEINNYLCKKIKIEKGEYEVNWRIPKTWNGNVNGSGILKVTSGEVIISDPCYHFNDSQWDKLLDIYDFFNTDPDGCLVLQSMGGDGEYNVYLNLKK